MKHTGHCYDGVAKNYAAVNDDAPYNAHYERPAVLSLLPPLEGIKVLEAACGPGWYAQHLARHGALVTACDRNAEFVEITRKRVPDAKVVQADLTEPLEFADRSFDLVVCALAMHYLEDWVAPLREFRRVLGAEGSLVFSTHHPFADWQMFNIPDYFGTQVIHDNFPNVGPISYYRRPLTAMFEALREAGFVVERLVEPQPTAAFREADPEGYERLMKEPCFIVMRARPA
jgi:ubiquinone/menaquinone biosynthesis C-methylase UbiE